MPNRILKESICVSDSIDQLSWFEEVLFYRLIVSCDDYGRYDGRPAIIKNRLFPLKENLTLKNVSAAINKLASAGLVVLYEFEGKPFLCLPTWNEHQTVRAKRSKYPAPEDGVKTSEIICKQVQADVPVIQSNTKSNTVSESVSETDTRTARQDAGFEKFWAAYPKKVGKQAALSAYKKVKVPVDTMISAVEAQKRSAQWTKENGRYIPNPATWLNQGRWEDVLETPVETETGWTMGAEEMEAIRAMKRRRIDATR
jgi:hypothetical protein